MHIWSCLVVGAGVCNGGNTMGNTDVLDGRDSIWSWDGVWDSNWVGDSIWCWYIIWLRNVLGDKRGDVLGLVDGLGDSNIIALFHNVQFRADLGDLGSVRDNGATKSLDAESLDVLWANSSIGDGCGDVEVNLRVDSGNSTSVHCWVNGVS